MIVLTDQGSASSILINSSLSKGFLKNKLYGRLYEQLIEYVISDKIDIFAILLE